ncbi:hypothetical protein L0F63_001860 [Massospora cicadina]|nr:hypothetical protein L0F63_001860 [Massospora cicadina]
MRHKEAGGMHLLNEVVSDLDGLRGDVPNFANLPSHLPPQVLYDQLVAGLMAYGTQPNLIFAISSGVERLAAPRATAIIIPHHPTIAQQIPPRASVAAAPDHFFWAWVNNERALRPSPLLWLLSLLLEVQYGALCCPLPPSNLVQWAHMKISPSKTSSLTLPPKSTPANQSNAWTTIGTQAAAHSPNPTHPNSNATIPVNQNPWDLLDETAESARLSCGGLPHCPKLCTAVAQSVAQLQHGLPTLFFPQLP